MQLIPLGKEQDLRRKRTIVLGSVFMIMAAVTCIAFLFIQANPSNIQQLNLQIQNSTLKFSLQSLTFHSVISKAYPFKLRSIGLTQKKLSKILAITSSYDQNIQNRTIKLTLGYFFDIIDTDNDQLISQKEWSAFVTALFPQDTGKYVPLFKEFNFGKSFNFEQFCGLIGKKLQGDIQPLTPVTQSQVSLKAFEKLIIFDSRNYELTFTLIFKICDQDDNKILTKAELNATLTAFEMKESQANEKTNAVFSFAQQYKISADGQTIKFADFKQFALGYQKVLQEQYKTAFTQRQIENLEAQLFLTKIQEDSRMIILQTYSNVFADTENTKQKAIKQHLFDTITEFEFQLFNQNGDAVVSKAEYSNVIDAIYKNQEDRKHYYSEFNAINGGKDVTLKQFQAAILKKIQSSDQLEHYIPLENPKKIGRRAFSFIVNNDRNYTLSSEFIFNLFDLNSDKVVELGEVQTIIGAFTNNTEDISKLNEGAANAFKALSNQGVGDGSKITQVEWVPFTKKIRHQLIEVFTDPSDKNPRGRPVEPEDEPILMLSLI